MDSDDSPYSPDSVDGRRAGTDLADGYCAAVWVFRADLDAFFKHLKQPRRGYNSLSPCFSCPCTKATMKCVGAGAPWLNMIYDHTHDVLHILFADPELGLTVHTLHADYMHCKHLGTDQWFLVRSYTFWFTTSSRKGRPARTLRTFGHSSGMSTGGVSVAAATPI